MLALIQWSFRLWYKYQDTGHYYKRVSFTTQSNHGPWLLTVISKTSINYDLEYKTTALVLTTRYFLAKTQNSSEQTVDKSIRIQNTQELYTDWLHKDIFSKSDLKFWLFLNQAIVAHLITSDGFTRFLQIPSADLLLSLQAVTL